MMKRGNSEIQEYKMVFKTKWSSNFANAHYERNVLSANYFANAHYGVKVLSANFTNAHYEVKVLSANFANAHFEFKVLDIIGHRF